MADKRFNETTSKREMFAAMAMQSIIASDYTAGYEKTAAWSVEYADALIAALEKGAASESVIDPDMPY